MTERKPTKHVNGSYSLEYGAIWRKEIPLERERREFVNADVDRRCRLGELCKTGSLEVPAGL
jgi:hypothetical protein